MSIEINNHLLAIEEAFTFGQTDAYPLPAGAKRH
jgi:hypothetical protein